MNVNITKFQILNLNKEEVHTIYQSDRFYLAMDWDASAAGTSIHEGDYFDITLPDNMKFPSGTTAQDFDLKDVDGNVVAKAHVIPGPGDVGGTVHVTFTKAVENKYNVKGTIYLAAQFDETKIIKDAENVFTITVNSQAVSGSVIVQGAKPLQDEPLAKWGKPVPGHEDQAEWNVRINHKKANLPNAVISDSLSGGNGDERYIEDSFKLLEVEFNEYGSIVQEIQTIDLTGKLQLAPDGRSFTINLGNVNGKQYRLYYKSTYHAGTVLKNKATLDASSAHEEISYSYQSAESGGTAGGDLASKIKLTKVDGDDNSIPLKNAVFTVTRPDGTTFELTTGEDGTVISGVLVQGTYKVKEKTPPDGYELNGNEYTLEVTPTGGALKTICDRPIKTSASVTKKWVGGEGGEGVRERMREPERDLANRAVVGRLKRLDRGLHRRREVPADARAARIDRFRERTQPAVRVAPSFARPFGQKRRERLRAVGRLGAGALGRRAAPCARKRLHRLLVGQKKLARERRGARRSRPEVHRVQPFALPCRLVEQSLQHRRHRRLVRHARARLVLVKERAVRPAARDGAFGQGRVDGRGQKLGALRVAHDAKRRVDAQIERMRPQDARAHAVDRRYPGAVHLERLVAKALRTQRALDARLDLGGRLLRERDGQHLVDAADSRAAVGQKRVGDTLRERERLARARARGHEKGAVHVLHARALARRAGVEVHASRLLSQAGTGQNPHGSPPRGSGSTTPRESEPTASATPSSTASTSSENDAAPTASHAGPGAPHFSPSMPGRSAGPRTARSNAPDTPPLRP